MFLLDTNVLSELRRRERTHPKVAAWADSVQAADLFLSAITILEIEAGTLMLARRPSSTLTTRKSLICLDRGSKAQTTTRAGRVRQVSVSAVGGR